MAPLRVRIVGERLPGRVVGEHRNVHIGVQKGSEIVDLVPADAASAIFDLTIVRSEDDDYRGPYVHGKRGERFVYLVWADVAGDGGGPTMFSRVKVMLDAIPRGVVRASTTNLEAYLSLTDASGKLVTAAVRPPQVSWSSQ